ncbi:MAG: DUF1553 domain-containing protein [Planctomycetaceae bacterium]|nr:DUF1553 domain-containing protein [Planctomycetaceae bacterium]
MPLLPSYLPAHRPLHGERRFIPVGICLVTALLLVLPPVLSAAKDAEGIKFFESRIRPVLVERCFKCHSQQAKPPKGKLRLDFPRGWLGGGESGPALVAGKPAESLLISALKYQDYKMPPGGKLPAAIVKDFSTWIEMGAPTPTTYGAKLSPAAQETIDWATALDHWAYRPLLKSPPPAIRTAGWARNPIDRFILSGLEQNNLDPPARADNATLIRRVYFDLTGLPPSPQDLAKYRAVLNQPRGYRQLVDDLLDSPHYGERWGRHWLDVARYSDSNGADENKPYPLAWRYRNYVIRQFNQDTPYDVFVHQQIAGDLLAPQTTAITNDQINATTFLALGVKIDAEQDPEKKRSDMIDEQIDTIGRAFLGVTVGCARCHDHKFDPFTTEDYYAMAGVLRSTKLTNVNLKSDEQPVLKKRNEEIATQRQKLLNDVGRQLGQLAIEKPADYLRHVPTIVKWQNTQFDAELRIRLATTANRPLQPVGELIKLNDGGRIQRIQAETFARGNFGIVTDGYGKGIGIISDKNGSGLQTFEHDLNVPTAGIYQLDIRYAAAAARPGKLFLNGKLVKDGAVGEVTGGWNPEHQKWHVSGRYAFQAGANVLRFEVPNVMSHIDQIVLAPVLDDAFLTREAERYDRGDFSRIKDNYGKNIGIAATSRSNEISFMEFDIATTTKGPHLLQFRYAADASRPMAILLDGKRINKEAFKEVTGGWYPEHQKWMTEATIDLTQPMHTIRLETTKVSVHIDKMRLVPLNTASELPSPSKVAKAHQLNPASLQRWVIACQEVTTKIPEVANWLKQGGKPPTGLSALTEEELKTLLSRPAHTGELQPADKATVANLDDELKKNNERQAALGKIVAMAVGEGDINDMPIHVRGSHLQAGAIVQRRAPRLLTDTKPGLFPKDESGRLQLAHAITGSKTPLAARVISNRIWRWHFGKALVRSTENFGTSGETPTHPELLDYLAGYLLENNWSLKALHRHILESSTYRMGFDFNEQAAAKDPDNRWYWRHTPKRLEAEAIRDALLSASGEIDLHVGGAPFEGISTLSPSPQALMSNRRAYENSKRRSVYLPIVRTNVYKFLTLFDFPNPAFPTGNRHTTTLPTQAMLMLNSNWVQETAEAMARRLIHSEATAEKRIVLAYTLAFSRPPSASELRDAQEFITNYNNTEKMADERAWNAFCQLLFLSNEFIYIN